MAVAIPIILAATGASAAIGAAVGVSAALVTVGAAAAVQFSGVGKAIDRAASKVFGKDLVSIANIAGGVYLATTSFSGVGSAAEAGSSAANYVNGADIASDAASAAGSAASGGGVLASVSDTPLPSIDAGMSSGINVAPTTGISFDGGLSTYTPPVAAVTPTTPTIVAPQNATAPSGITSSGTASAPSIGNDLATGGVAAPVSATVQPTGFLSQAKSAIGDVLGNFGKLDPKTQAAVIQAGGGILQGAASGYAQSKALADQRQFQLEQDARYKTGSGLGHIFTYGPSKGILARG